jgi:hypothetical protein
MSRPRIVRTIFNHQTESGRIMPEVHPHAGAEYRVVPLPDGAYGVEVVIPSSAPTMVTPFASQADAEAWIAAQETRVKANPSLRKPRFRRYP